MSLNGGPTKREGRRKSFDMKKKENIEFTSTGVLSINGVHTVTHVRYT